MRSPVLVLALLLQASQATAAPGRQNGAPLRVGAPTTCGKPEKGGPARVVQTLYREFPWNGSKVVDHQPRKVLSRFFTSSVTDLLVRDYECTVREQGVCRIDWMMLYATQDPDISELRVCAADPVTRSVGVWFKNNGAVVSLTYEMEKTPAGWRITDIHYPRGPSLLEVLSAEP
jgi:hypothetical protein